MSTKYRYDMEYELISVSQVSGLVAVYEDRDANGTRVLETEKLVAIGVAKATLVGKSVDPEHKNHIVRQEEKQVDNEIVGLILLDGDFSIVQLDENFLGICHEGDDIEKKFP